MDIEDLNKSQLLLLTILVNFVVSIATGVLTVSLLDQAPAVVTQTVSQIVDHTIETISSSTPIQVPIATKPTPVVIPPSTEDLLTTAISGDATRTVTLYKGATTSPAIGVGVYLSKSRALATATTAALPTDIIVVFANGASEPASISHTGATITIYGFSDTATLPQVASAGLIASQTLKQGETVVAITADHSAVTGIVSRVDDTTSIHTTLPVIPAGAAAYSLAGNIMGISSGVPGLFFPADKIQTLLTATSTVPSS